MCDLLKLDSANRFAGTPSNFKLRLNDTLAGRFRLKSFYAANSFYNINSSNNTIAFYDSAARVTSLDPGFYTVATFLTALQTLMNSVSSGYTVTFSSQTGKITIANAASFSIQFTSSSIAPVLGSTDDTATVTSFTTGLVNLSPVRTYNIIINDSMSVRNPVTGSGWTMVIPCTVSSGGVQYYEVLQEASQSFNITSTKQLNIRVVNDSNVEVPLQSDWHIIIAAEESYCH